MTPGDVLGHLDAPTMARPVNVLDAALTYAGRGWPVLPLWWPATTGEGARCACPSSKCRTPGKHPYGPLVPRGLLDATTDPTPIRRWWSRAPLANVGIVLGQAACMFGVDVDPRNGGDRELARLVAEHGPIGDTLHTLTGGAGDHYFFAWPGWYVASGDHKIGRGVDVKGDGGYVVAPPSLHPSGARYAWERADAKPLAAPRWILDRACPPGNPIATLPLPPPTAGPVAPPLPPAPRRALPMVPPMMMHDHESLDVLVRECSFIAHCSRHASSVTYEQWFSLATVLHAFPEGDQLFDEISRQDRTRYDAGEARKKTATIHGKPRHCTSLGWTCPKLGECSAIGVRSPAGLPYKLARAGRVAA